jgi:Leucine-rich repeat (LRR) protein
MRKLVIALIALIPVALLLVSACRDEGDKTVVFADPNLEAAVRDAIARPVGYIHESDLEELKYLSTGAEGVRDLSALEHCTDLTHFDASDNDIVDISRLSELKNLTHLDLEDNRIVDLSPLSELTSLTDVELDKNRISDISPLSNLIGLNSLELEQNEVRDIWPLSNLTNLSNINLKRNEIIDIAPLLENSGLGEGDLVNVGDNPLSEKSESVIIPELERRGVTVEW